VVTWIIGALLGLPSLRVREDFLAVVTMGLGLIIQSLALNLKITGGPMGIGNIKQLSLFGLRFGMFGFFIFELILIGICILIVITVFSVNVIRRMKEDSYGNQDNIIISDNVITRAEAYRLLSYLEYSKTDRESLTYEVSYSKEQMTGWYDTYVNAVYKMGLIDEKVTINPKEALTYGSCKELMDRLIMEKPALQTVYNEISFDFTTAEQEMSLQDFIELYEAILTAMPKEDKLVQEETLLVLGQELTEDGKDRMITDRGKYYYGNAKSYEHIYDKLSEISEKKMMDKTTVSEVNDTEDTEKDVSEMDLLHQYLDKGIKALVCDQELVYITDVTEEKIVIHNVWIEQGEGLQVDVFINGLHKSFSTLYKLSSSIKTTVGDITIENQKVIQISLKPDTIQGKVLQTSDDYIEIKGYGKLPLEEDYKIYKIYGELSMEPTGSILVGYENTKFIVSEGKISAALITENIKAENIRVLLKTTGYQGIFHDTVEFTSSSDFTVSDQNKEVSYQAGERVTMKPGDKLLSEGRITIKPTVESAKIEILSIERGQGNPKYRGTIEISKGDNGLLIVNELPLEEYLYAVIPSEMPTGYGLEALKVQAVCARSYAYNHLLANSLSIYGAHVDDSVSYQVYNNIAENEDTILAVKDTYGEVIKYEDNIITAYYFSTSCGHTAKASDVWVNSKNYPYLSGKLLAIQDEDSADVSTQSSTGHLYEDLSSEETFRSFITENTVGTYDDDFNWYRWKVTMKVKELKKVIDQTLAGRYNANPELILTMTKKAKKGNEAVFESIPVDTVGDLVDISVLKRESSGIVSQLLIEGSKNTIKVCSEYNIRMLLAPLYDTITRKDDTKVKNLSLLPSAFIAIDRHKKGEKLSSITLVGGGFGHGVGMSQNGVKGLTDAGKDYKEIVNYFYEGTKLGFIYE